MTRKPTSATRPRELRYLSLFSGAGGMDLGLEFAGFTPISCLELDRVAQQTLQQNRPNWPVAVNGDVVNASSTMTPSSFGMRAGELDLLAGGPPCQPFSTAGQWSATGRQGMIDPRAVTVHALLDLFESFRPKFVLLENVQGFLSGANSALNVLKERIEHVNEKYSTNYQMSWQILNAADYGVPQNRRRAITVIADKGLGWGWPEKTHEKNPVTAWDALANLKQDSSEIPTISGKWAELLPCIPEGHNYQWLTKEGGGDELFGYRTRYWNFLLKLAKGKPSWTLPASPGPSTGPFHWDNRPLSIKERLRLQSFPDDWQLSGNIRDQVKLVGNATPPLLAERLGLEMANLLGFERAPKSSTLQLGRTVRTPKESVPSPLPSKFKSLVGTKEAHAGEGRGPAAKELMPKLELELQDRVLT